jgi:GTP cyclohydrolase I
MTGHDHATTESEAKHTDTAAGDPAANGHKPDSSIDWEQAQEGARLILDAMGEDPDAEPLQETWQRRVPEMLETLSEGNRSEEKPTLRTFETEGDELVVKTGIEFQSLCEHHLLPYTGTAHIAYRPSGSVVGLSKLIRYVRWQSRRPTIQEGLTRDIAAGLADELGAEAIVVELSATHLCEVMRGIESETVTSTQATVGDLTQAERQRFENTIRRTTD